MEAIIMLNNVNYRIKAKFLKDVQGFPFDEKDMMHHNEYRITIINQETKKRVSFKYYGSQADWRQGKIEFEKDDLIFAFCCMLSDGLSGLQNDFYGFCSEFGYDTDSRTAEKTYKACLKSSDKAEILGFDENSLCDALNYLSENYGC